MGLILLIVSILLKLILAPFLYLFGTIVSLSKGEYFQWDLDLAIAKDQYGNALGKYLFNLVLIKKESKHHFGNIKECLSSVIGKNKRDNTLTLLGRFIDNILDILQPNHSLNSIDDSEQD